MSFLPFLKIVILSLPPESSPGLAPCLAFEFLVDVSIFYRTIGGLGIVVFRQEPTRQRSYNYHLKLLYKRPYRDQPKFFKVHICWWTWLGLIRI